ncbi:hypothetical protein RB195_017899 [Necator americanus]|uniref:Uncharacterized protein n=2 Tax=Necator americanus TaxID=51031 RepID=W2TBG0_NECAM|nr:hypothetical protein NECAME_10427 [Necator americanus]ETN78327.1 hypothetical protein NECAME_10427 [Necator americanus]
MNITALPLSLMERHIAKEQHPKKHQLELRAPVLLHNFIVDNELDHISVHKSISNVGSFRGLPIMSRQKSVYIDSNGEALSVLPYNDDSRRIHSPPNRYG